MSRVGNKEQGMGHIGVVIVIVVVAAVVASGYFVWKKHNETAGVDPVVAAALKDVKCDLSDKDICKFFTSFKAQKYSTIHSTETTGSKTTISTYQIEGTDKYHIEMAGGDSDYDSIGIGTNVYTKAGDGTWWKQTIQPSEVDKHNTGVDSKLNFTEPDTNSKTAQSTYTKVGTEKCGDGNKLTCFKYQVIDPSLPNVKQYIWFDNQAYQLRRMQTVSSDGTSDATFSYAKVTITAPSPAKELGANQYLVPGQSQPVTIPTEDTSGGTPSAQDLQNLQNLAQQYQQSYPQ